MPGFYVSLSAQDDRPFDGIAQFPHIAWPVMSHQPGQHLPIHSLNLSPVLGIHVGQQGFNDGGDVFFMFPQRWHMQVKNVQPVVQISTQMPVSDRFLWIFVGGRQYPHVHRRLDLAA